MVLWGRIGVLRFVCVGQSYIPGLNLIKSAKTNPYACLTELEPEEMGEGGTGRTLTRIGFRPLPDEVAHAISRKFQLYR